MDYNSDEHQYLDLLKLIKKKGVYRCTFALIEIGFIALVLMCCFVFF